MFFLAVMKKNFFVKAVYAKSKKSAVKTCHLLATNSSEDVVASKSEAANELVLSQP